MRALRIANAGLFLLGMALGGLSFVASGCGEAAQTKSGSQVLSDPATDPANRALMEKAYEKKTTKKK